MVFESLQRCWWSPQALLLHFQQAHLPNEQKKPTSPFSKSRVGLLSAFLARLAIFLKESRFFGKNRAVKFFLKIALFASRKIGPKENPRFFRFLPIFRRVFQHWPSLTSIPDSLKMPSIIHPQWSVVDHQGVSGRAWLLSPTALKCLPLYTLSGRWWTTKVLVGAH